MSSDTEKQRVLIFIVAYNAEKTIESVLERIPHSLADAYDVEVLIIDDSSQDATFERGEAARQANTLPFPLHVLFNPVNQGYGGNQKIGFHFAIERGFDFVALVHGDGQYAPECLPELLQPLAAGEADAVFGSRMLTRGTARAGGMPLYKFVGNKILTWFQNSLLRADLSEFHSGYRIYSVDALRQFPFHLNTNVFHFDTEIIIQLLFAGQRIKELPIPTYYGDEICHVDGLKYAWDVAVATSKARAQELSIFYDRKFDVERGPAKRLGDESKLTFDSGQSRALAAIPEGSRVLDLNPEMTYLSKALVGKGCTVDGLGPLRPDDSDHFSEFVKHDLSSGAPLPPLHDYDYVLLLDVMNKEAEPEVLVDQLREASALGTNTRFFVTAGNIGFFIPRLMHFLGQFNYSKRGTLDLYSRRLFVFSSLRRLFEQGGFEVIETRGIPAPYPLAIGDNVVSRALLKTNSILARLWSALFAYQIYAVVRLTPTLPFLLQGAYEQSAERAKAVAEAVETKVKTA